MGGSIAVKRITLPGAIVVALVAGLALAALAEAAKPPRPPSGLAGAASVSPTVQFLNDTLGSTFTFTVRNSGTVGIGAVEIARPSSAWTATACPKGPSGWSPQLTPTGCRYKSLLGGADNIGVGSSSSQFELVSTTTGGSQDRTGTWMVTISAADSLDDATQNAVAVAEGTGLATTAYSFEILDVVVGTGTPGSACPAPAAGDHDAVRGASVTLLVCGRNRSTGADALIARRSTIGGTFLAAPGTFGAATVPANSPKTILARWTSATVAATRASGHSLTLKVASGTSRTAPPTRLDDSCPVPGEWCVLNGGYKIANRNPIANDDATFLFLTDERTPFITPSVLDNDSDPDGDALTVVSLDSSATLGLVASNGDGKFTYDPNGRFDSLNDGDLAYDSFRYSVGDGFGGGASARVTITIVGRSGHAPVAVDDEAFTTEDDPVTIDVLANDTDAEGNPLSITIVTPPTGGGSAVIVGSSIVFDPGQDFQDLAFMEWRSATFEYQVGDPVDGTDTGFVRVTIAGKNDAPIPVDDAVTTTEDDVLLIDVLANDSDPDASDTLIVLSCDVTGLVGELALTRPVLTYDPRGRFDHLAPGETATDTFLYQVEDGQGALAIATVTITVTGASDGPFAVDDIATTDEDSPIDIAVLDNDSAAGSLAILGVGVPTGGGVATVQGSTVKFAVNADFQDLQVGGSRMSSFTYTIGDGQGGTATATVSVTVTGANDYPSPGIDAYGGILNTKLVVGATSAGPAVFITGSLLANDTDVDDPASSLRIHLPPGGDLLRFGTSRGGTVDISADGTFVYVPNAANNIPAYARGDDWFFYPVVDPGGLIGQGRAEIAFGPTVVWYVQPRLGPGDGRSTSPFSSLQPLGADGPGADVDGPGDTIFVHSGQMTALAPLGGLQLEPGQSLIGAPVGLTIDGVELVPPNPDPVTMSGGLLLDDAVRVLGIQLGNASAGQAPAALAGGGADVTVGGPGAAQVSIANSAGRAVDLLNATGSIALASVVSANSPTQGIQLTNVGGTFIVQDGSITDAAGTDIEINGGTGAVTIGATVLNHEGGTISVTDRFNGVADAVRFQARIQSFGGSGIYLAENGLATISFSGGLEVRAADAFVAQNGGTVSVTGTDNVLSGSNGVALRLHDTAIGLDHLLFRSISAMGSAFVTSGGIEAVNTGTAGRLVVTGDPSSQSFGTGGTLSGYTGSAIVLRDTFQPSFERMTVGGRVSATDVTGLSIYRGQINGSVELVDVRGSTLIQDSSISRSFENDVAWRASAGTATLSIVGSTIGPSGTPGAPGLAGVSVEAGGSADMHLFVVGGQLLGRNAAGIAADARDDSRLKVLVQDSTIVDSGAGIVLDVHDDADMTFDVTNNTILRSTGYGILVATEADTTTDARIRGFVAGNRIGDATVDSGARDRHGIAVDVDGDADAILAIEHNVIRHVDQQGIHVRAHDTGGSAGMARLDLRLLDNTVSEIDDNGTDEYGDPAPVGTVPGIVLESLVDATTCLDVAANASAGINAAHLALRQAGSSIVELEDFMGNGSNTSEVETYLAARNATGTTVAASHTAPFVGVAPGTCRRL